MSYFNLIKSVLYDACRPPVIFTGKKDYYTSKIHNAQLHAINVKYTRLSYSLHLPPI